MEAKIEISLEELSFLYELMYQRFLALNHAKKNLKLEVKDLPISTEYKLIIHRRSKKVKFFHTLPDLINTELKSYLLELKRSAKKSKSKDKKRNKYGIVPDTLYKLILKMFDPSKPKIHLTGIYRTAYFKFLGLRDIDHFRSEKFKLITYTGYYYSKNPLIENIRVKEFLVELKIPQISFKSEHPNDVRRYDAVINSVMLKGFHDPDEDKIMELRGKLEHIGECWVSQVRCQVQDYSYFLNLTLHVGALAPKTMGFLQQFNVLTGTLTGSISDLSLYCGECILIKDPVDEKMKTNVERYLNLKRAHFYCDARPMIKRSKFLFWINGKNIDYIEPLSNKVYKILSASKKSYTLSRFEILKDYRAKISVPYISQKNGKTVQEIKHYDCHLSFDNIIEGRLLISAATDGGVYYSTTVIQLMPTNNKILRGAFCITYDADVSVPMMPSGSKFVMVEADGEKWNPGIFAKIHRDYHLKDYAMKVLMQTLEGLIK